MDLNHVQTFLRVVEAGSFTGAAKALGVPTSTVSRQVAQLEETLGVRLLQRTSRSLHLTEAGAAYHERIAPALSALHEASAEARDQQGAPGGMIRMTMPVDIAVEAVAGPLAKFQQLYPSIRLDVVLTARTVDMVAEGFDLALRAGVVRDGSLIARKLGEGEIGLVASEAYLRRRGEPADLGQLASHDCIGFRPHRGRCTWDLVGPDGPEKIDIDCRVGADDFMFIRALLLADVGIALAPLSILTGPLRERAVRRILPAYGQRAGGLSLVYPSAKHLPRRVALLRDFLIQQLSQVPTC